MGPPALVRLVPLLAVVLGLVAACGVRKEYVIDDVDVRHLGWDTLQVEADFAWRAGFGGAREAVPDEVAVNVFDSAYDTLYAGPPGALAVPDRRLADRERLTVEVCGAFGRRVLCTQQVVRASPKRIRVDQDIEYPVAGDYDAGRYDLAFHVERRRFEDDDWEALDVVPEISGYLRASVGDREQSAVTIPFDRPQGRFDLARYEHYKDFKYYLESALVDERQAHVSFDVYGGIKGQVARLASTRKDVHVRTREERMEDVRHYVQQAVARIVDELDVFLGGRGAVAYVRDWRFDALTRTYRVDLEVEWRGSVFNGRRLALDGELRVGEGGASASFERRKANRRAAERWEERVRGDVLQLGALDPPPPPDEDLRSGDDGTFSQRRRGEGRRR